MSILSSVFCFFGLFFFGLWPAYTSLLADKIKSDSSLTKTLDWNSWDVAHFAQTSKKNQFVFLFVEKDQCSECLYRFEELNKEGIKNYIETNYFPIRISSAERPDLGIYFSQVLQLLKGTTAWPFAVVLTPNGKPVWADSFSSTDDLLETLEQFQTLWGEERGKKNVLQKSRDIATELTHFTSHRPKKVNLDNQIFQIFYNRALVHYDRDNHGFGKNEKMPPSQKLMMLMRIYRRTGAPPAKEIVLSTLQTMRTKKLLDKSDYGFFYGTNDDKWKRHLRSR